MNSNLPDIDAQGRLAGKVALLTGAGLGLGGVIAQAMAREGARLIICAINPDALEQTTSRLARAKVDRLAVRCYVALYPASDEHYLVGQVISPNGGMLI